MLCFPCLRQLGKETCEPNWLLGDGAISSVQTLKPRSYNLIWSGSHKTHSNQSDDFMHSDM